MGERIKQAIKAKPIPWVGPVERGRCTECQGPRHRQWWRSTPPPSCQERVLKYG